MSEIQVNKISPSSGTGLTLGDSGDTLTLTAGANLTLGGSSSTITIPSGATIANSGTATGFGGTMTPAFHAYSPNSFQAIGNATATTVNVSNERFDSDNAFDTSTKRFTPQTAGKYFVYGNVVLDGNWSAYGRLYLALNGNAAGGETLSSHASGDGNDGVHVSGIINMNGSSDYVELMIRHDGGGSKNLWNSGQVNFFGGFRVLL